MSPNKRSTSTPAEPASSQASKRQLTLDAAVAQKLRNNFSSFTPEETDVITNEKGETLRQHLRALMQTDGIEGKKVIWGKVLYASLKQTFGKQNRREGFQLKGADNEQIICPELLQALLRHPLGFCSLLLLKG